MAGNKRGGGGGRGSGGQGNRKKAKYYDKAKTPGSLPPLGSRGFLVSCETGMEGKAVHEALRVLNEFYERLEPDEGRRQPVAAAATHADGAAEGEEEEEQEGTEDKGGGGAGAGGEGGKQAEEGGGAAPADFEALLAEEVADLSNKKKRAFRPIKLGIGGLLYIVMASTKGDVGPVEVATALMEEVAETKQLKSRLCIRFLPIDVVCEANLGAIEDAAKKMLPGHFPSDGDTVQFAVQYEHRANKQMDRMKVIDAIADNVSKPPHKVNLSSPDKTVMVQVLKNVACLGVIPRYVQLGKFNIRSIVNPPEKQPEQKQGEEGAKKQDGEEGKDEPVTKEEGKEEPAAKEEAKEEAASKEGAKQD